MSNPADSASAIQVCFSAGVSISLNWMVRCLVFRLSLAAIENMLEKRYSSLSSGLKDEHLTKAMCGSIALAIGSYLLFVIHEYRIGLERSLLPNPSAKTPRYSRFTQSSQPAYR